VTEVADIDWHGLRRLGFSIFPLKARDKRPFAPWKAYQDLHPSDADLAAWSRRPGINAAIVCGAISGVIVLDTDTDEGEADVVARGVPATPTVRTAKGRHRYFRHPGGKLENFVRKVPGVDFRGDGGYVVAPGSIHPTGVLYRWEIAPADCPFAPPPTWLMALFEASAELLPPAAPAPAPAVAPRPVATDADRLRRWTDAVIDKRLGEVRRAAQGGRNNALNIGALQIGHLVGGGLVDHGWAERELTAAGLALGLAPREVAATVKSGLDAGMREPVSGPEDKDRPRERVAPPVPPGWLLARAAWKAGAPVDGSPADAWLRERGVTSVPPSLRFAELADGDTGELKPALMGVLTDLKSQLAGLYVAYLGGGTALLGGPFEGAALKLAASAGPVLVLTLSPSRGLQLQQHPEAPPVWCLLRPDLLAALRLPRHVRQVRVAADRDLVGAALRQLGHQGVEVRTI
jgi:hypothetical protein